MLVFGEGKLLLDGDSIHRTSPPTYTLTSSYSVTITITSHKDITMASWQLSEETKVARVLSPSPPIKLQIILTQTIKQERISRILDAGRVAVH